MLPEPASRPAEDFSGATLAQLVVAGKFAAVQENAPGETEKPRRDAVRCYLWDGVLCWWARNDKLLIFREFSFCEVRKYRRCMQAYYDTFR